MFLKFQNLPYPSSPEALAPFVEKAEAEVKPHLLKYGEEHWDAARVKARLREARQWADAKGVAIWCGEFGVTRLGPPLAPRRVWLADVKRALDELGIPWALFGYAGHFGLVTGKAGERELDPADAAALDLPAKRGAAAPGDLDGAIRVSLPPHFMGLTYMLCYHLFTESSGLPTAL